MKKVFCVAFAMNVLGSVPAASFASPSIWVSNAAATYTMQDRNSISGFIFDETRRPIADAYVELLNEFYATVARTKTNGTGIYSFKGLASGNYNVKVSFYGGDYEPQTKSVALVGVSPVPGRGAVSEQIDFFLKVKPNLNSGPLAAPTVVYVQEVPADAKKLYEQGIELLRAKKDKEGFEKLKNALEVFPDYYLALDRLGTEYVVRGYYEAAYVLLTKAIAVNSRSFSSSFGLGLSTYRLGKNDLAISHLRKATEIYNKSASAFLWLGIALLQNKQLSKAETALLAANKISKGESAEVHWQLARLYKEQERFADSANELELFLKHKEDAENAEQIKETIKLLRKKSSVS